MRTICFIECSTVDELLAPWQEVPRFSFEGTFISLISNFFGREEPFAIHKILFPMFDPSCNVAHGEIIYLLSYPDNGERALISRSEDAITQMCNLMSNCGMYGPCSKDVFPKVADIDLLQLKMWEPTTSRDPRGPRIMVNIDKQQQ